MVSHTKKVFVLGQFSAPALSSRSTNKVSIPVTSNEASSRNSWKAFTNGDLSQTSDLDDNSSFGVASPFLKSFMQVRSSLLLINGAIILLSV